MRSIKIHVSCLILSVFALLNCSREPTEPSILKAHFSAFDATCDVHGICRVADQNRACKVCLDYIDIEYASVSIDGNNLLCTLVVTVLPDSLLFNRDSVMFLDVDYEWLFTIRSKTDSADYVYLYIGHQKKDTVQFRGSFVDNIYCGLGLWTKGDGVIYYDRPVDLTKKGDTLIMHHYDISESANKHIINSSIRIDAWYPETGHILVFHDSLIIEH